MFNFILAFIFSFQAIAQTTPNANLGNTAINLFPNGGMEPDLNNNNRITKDWTASGGTLLGVTSGSNFMYGKGTLTWDSSAASQTLTHAAISIPNGIKGQNGLMTCDFYVQTGTPSYKFQIFDGTNVLNEINVTTNGKHSVNFIYPTSGSLQPRLLSVDSNEPLISIDGCSLGLATNISNVSQAQFVGSIKYAGATNCLWSRTGAGSDSFDNFAADTDCPSATVTGQASAPGTKIPAIVLNNLGPGRYVFIASGSFVKGGATDNLVFFRFSDGTNVSQVSGVYSASNVGSGSTIVGEILRNNSAGSLTVNLQGLTAATGNSVQIVNNLTTSEFTISAYRYPLASEVAVTPDLANWKLDLNISGANVDLGTAAQSAYVAPNNANLTMTVNTAKGSAPAGISCSGTNDNSVGNTTCPTGNEELGFVANFPRAGLVEVCHQFSHYFNGSGNSIPTFQIIRTANGSQTIVEEGGARTPGISGNTNVAVSYNNCGTFQIPSAAKHTIRLMYEQTTAATVTTNQIIADAAAANGQRDVKITARYIDQQTPMPVIANSVATPLAGGVRIVSALVSDTGVVSLESGDWLNGNCTNASPAVCTFNSGIFSSTPVCVFSNAQSSTSEGGNIVVTATTASIQFSSNVKRNFQLICTGPR
jgi:hypothetical protein